MAHDNQHVPHVYGDLNLQGLAKAARPLKDHDTAGTMGALTGQAGARNPDGSTDQSPDGVQPTDTPLQADRPE